MGWFGKKPWHLPIRFYYVAGLLCDGKGSDVSGGEEKDKIDS